MTAFHSVFGQLRLPGRTGRSEKENSENYLHVQPNELTGEVGAWERIAQDGAEQREQDRGRDQRGAVSASRRGEIREPDT